MFPDQHKDQLLTTSSGSFLNSLDSVSVTILCSGKHVCESKRGFAKEKGVRDKGQKDLGNANVATHFSDASSPDGACLARACSLWSVSECRSACVRLVVLGS